LVEGVREGGEGALELSAYLLAGCRGEGKPRLSQVSAWLSLVLSGKNKLVWPSATGLRLGRLRGVLVSVGA